MTDGSAFKVGEAVFSGGTHVMGILNVTPDSFYPASRVCEGLEDRAEKMVRDGAEIIDIGGQSTKPTAEKISPEEEAARVIPAVERLKACIRVPISVDTFYPQVASLAIKAGADMINDVSCLLYDGMAQLIAESGVSVCVMQDRRKSNVADLFADKIAGLSEAANKLLKAGVNRNRILLDGGIGFNKSNAEDRMLLNNYKKLMRALPDFPFLLGTSRKSMFGGDVNERLQATLESTVKAVKDGVRFIRVHDVKENAAVIRNSMKNWI